MPSPDQLPTGTVTFLFTDIEGSTKLVHALGDSYEAVLERHHVLMRAAIEGCGGIEVATEGDSFFVVFTSADAAIESAVAAQRNLTSENWGEGVEVRVRMGLHTGAGKLVGDNYGGIDVHRAARISSAAHGEQILLSEATQALVAQSLPDGIRLIDLDRHELKDLEQPEHLYQLCVDGLRTEFPPPRSKSARIHNLPTQLTPFIGRDKVLGEVCSLLSNSRVLTLTGPGGTGKTRLSLAAAERAVEDFDDGIFIVFLAPVTDDMLVPSTIAHALGLRDQGDTPIQTIVKEYLGGRNTLLILDNFEQVVSAAPAIADLIAAAPNLKVLVSSRIPLRIAGEQEYAVPPMDLPDPNDLPSLEMLSHFEAIDLFLQRASAVRPNFALNEDNAHAIAEICNRLDGLPLAIELATARLRLMTPQEMVGRLDQGLAFLKGGQRDLPERQQTLRGAIAWSYDLLDEDQRKYFRSLGVFSGGFTLEAAESVVDPDGDLGFDAIETIVDNSLVRRIETSLGTTRFRMLQTIREFAQEMLREAGEEDELRARHAEYFVGLIESLSPRFTMDVSSLEEAELDHDNLRAALRWSIDSGATATAQKAATSLWRFWQARGHLAEARRWLTEILAMPRSEEATVERARAVMALGSIAYWQNDFDETRRRYEEALEAFRTVDDQGGLQEALYNSGFLWLLERDPAPAQLVFEESRSLAEARGDIRGQASAAWGLAMSAIQAGDFNEASKWRDESRRLFEQISDVFGIGLARFVGFQIARYTKRYDEARALMREYLAESLDNTTEAMSSLELIAEIELQEGNLERGVKLAAAGRAFRDEYGGGSPAALVDVSDAREIARRVLDEDTIEKLWAEGYAWPRSEAIAYALKEE